MLAPRVHRKLLTCSLHMAAVESFLTLSLTSIYYNRRTIDMVQAKKAKIRRCPTCKVVFPTIDALNDHYKATFHTPRYHWHPRADTSPPFLYKCEPCNQVFLFKISSLLRVRIQLLVLKKLLLNSADTYGGYPHIKHFHLEHPLLPLPYCEACKQFDTSNGIQKVVIQA